MNYILWQGLRGAERLRDTSRLNIVFQNDVALIELKTEATLNHEVSPACVNKEFSDVIEYESCETLGWGKANESSEFSEKLRTVSLNVLN